MCFIIFDINAIYVVVCIWNNSECEWLPIPHGCASRSYCSNLIARLICRLNDRHIICQSIKFGIKNQVFINWWQVFFVKSCPSVIRFCVPTNVLFPRLRCWSWNVDPLPIGNSLTAKWKTICIIKIYWTLCFCVCKCWLNRIEGRMCSFNVWTWNFWSLNWLECDAERNFFSTSKFLINDIFWNKVWSILLSLRWLKSTCELVFDKFRRGV